MLFFLSAVSAYNVVGEMVPSSITSQAFTGHGGFSAYLHRFKCAVNPLCFCAADEDQTTNDIAEMTWENQHYFLEATIHNPLIKNYPLSKEFSRLFFKKLITYLEPVHDVHDEMYMQLCDLMNNNNLESDNFHYRHYIVGDDLNNSIIIKETNNMVVNGTTGMRTWQAALMIADWALCHRKSFNYKKILELGSGVGFTGIAIAKLCNTKEFIFTDYHNDVLKTICDNININFPDIEKDKKLGSSTFWSKGLYLGVMTLDWNNFEDFPSDIVPDIIIGADIIYDPILINPLCNVIRTFIRRNENVEVYIASVIRNKETFDYFLSRIDSMDFKYEVLLQPQCTFFQWDNSIERCLISIKKQPKLT